MRHPISLRLLTLTLVVLGPVGRLEAAGPSPSPAPAVSNLQLTATLMRLPLQFEANQGQVDAQVTFLARGTGYTLFLTPSESILVLQQREPTPDPARRERGKPTARPERPAIKQAVVRMTLEGANPTPAVEGMEPLPGIVNYFIGNDPAKWRTNIPTYAKVQYHDAYPGIDLAYYGNQGTVEYDFIVAPGADPDQIRLAFEGASAMHLVDSGDLVLATALGDVRIQKPLVYQVDPEGHRTLVAGHYLVERPTAEGHPNPQQPACPPVSIQLAAYDRTKPLVIDPVLLYSTYLGGSSGDYGAGIAVDGSGQAYVTGFTGSVDFPTLQASQPASGGEGDAFVTKLTATGALAYSTYLGGSGFDGGGGIAVDGSGQAYVTGGTASGNFPTLHASQPAFGGEHDAFVTKLTATGALAYSTYLGGSGVDGGGDIAVDGSGQAYVTGLTTSGDFPTVQASQPAYGGGGSGDAFVTKLTATGALAYSTYLGGSERDAGRSIAVDGSGQAYVTGNTTSGDFPTLHASQPASGGGDEFDAFVTKLTATGALAYSTYLGGSAHEAGLGIAVDGSGQTYVTGSTLSGDFPTLHASQPASGGGGDAFVTKLMATGALAYSTYLGGGGSSSGDQGTGIAVDGSGQAYVTGLTQSGNFPTLHASQPAFGGGDYDAFVTKLSASVTNQPPVCRAAQASPAVLWAPDHQLVPIAIMGVTDPDGDAVTITVTGVTQDEPVNGNGNTSPDAVIQAGAASVRAERSGNGNGRVYRISFTADDGKGSSCSGAVTVGVPHSQKKGLTAIDDGPLYTSTSP
jgi:hypothetical protein